MGGLFYRTIPTLTILTSNRYSFPSGSRADLHTRPEGPSLRMGWDGMGWDGRFTFFFAYLLKTNRYFFVIISDPIKRQFSTSFETFSEKNQNFKNFAKIKHPFFANIFTSISRISQKLINIFSWLCLVPLEGFSRQLLWKTQKK